jgi:hypothetical protein
MCLGYAFVFILFFTHRHMRATTMKRLEACLLCVLLFQTSATASVNIIFATSNEPTGLWKLPMGGTEAKKFMRLPSAGRSIAVDPVNGAVFYEAAGVGLFRKNRLLIEEDFWDFELDPIGGYLYHPDEDYGGSIYRSRTDGTGRELVWHKAPSLPFNFPSSIALDTVNGHIYVGDSGTNSIWRINLDGSNQTTIVSFGVNVDLSDVEVSGAKLYWTDQLLNRIQRSNLDGSGIEDVVADGYGRRIAIDERGGKIYWGTTTASSGSPPNVVISTVGGLYRANLDGTNQELVLAHEGDIHGIDFDYRPSGSVPEPSSFVSWTLLACWMGCLMRRFRNWH